jgi:hypothetical protein
VLYVVFVLFLVPYVVFVLCLVPSTRHRTKTT